MQLVIVHSHFRPGGVRRVIELAVPHLVGALRPRVRSVVLATGEAPDARWLDRFRAGLGLLPVRVATDPAVGYVAEHRLTPAARTRRLRRFLADLLTNPSAGSVVWAHNPCLGRNLALTRELTRATAARGVPLVLHHHDWWCDNRWQRWPEMRRAGCRSLAQVAAAILPAAPHVRHAAINQPDAAVLRRHLGRQSAWLPNPVDLSPRPAEAAGRTARRWLTTQLGESAPVWLVPCRLLRRKNLAEALLLTRWLRPEAWLVTTGGITSPEEADYARRLEQAARAAGWKLCLGLLAEDEGTKPTVPELTAASEAILLTSLLEGFGLPCLEAAAAHRPLITRALPNIAPDLARFGFRFPQAYAEILIDPALFNRPDETRRQRELLRHWRQALPRACRAQAGQPALLAAADPRQPVPFSRLTLAAQLEVLHQLVADSWRLCAPLNPFLPPWREAAARGRLRITRWPRAATAALSGATYARKFAALLHAQPRTAPPPAAGNAVQAEFIRRKLRPANLYPLTWSSAS